MRVGARFLIQLMVGASVCCVVIVSIVRQVQRNKYIKAEKTSLLERTHQEIAELKQLGFADTDKVMQIVRHRVQRLHKQINQLNTLLPVVSSKIEVQQRTSLVKLLHIHKKMIRSYAHDLQDYHKLGIAKDHHVVKFAYHQLVRLAVSYAELDHQVKKLRNGERIENNHVQKIRRMMAINDQSVGYYKQEIARYQADDEELCQEQLSFARKQLTKKVEVIAALEGLLE